MASKSTSLLVMVTSQDQNEGRSHNTNRDKSSFKKVKQFKYLGKTVTY